MKINRKPLYEADTESTCNVIDELLENIPLEAKVDQNFFLWIILESHWRVTARLRKPLSLAENEREWNSLQEVPVILAKK